MKTYKHNTYKHTVTAEDHETTKQRILVESGWYLVPEAVADKAPADVEVFETPKPKAKK